MSTVRRALFCYQPGHSDERRQSAHVIAYAAEHGYMITAFSVDVDVDEVLLLVRQRLVDVVLVDVATRGTEALGEQISAAGGRLEAVHQRRPRSGEPGSELDLLRRRVAELEALLGERPSVPAVPVRTVPGARYRERRPERLGA